LGHDFSVAAVDWRATQLMINIKNMEKFYERARVVNEKKMFGKHFRAFFASWN